MRGTGVAVPLALAGVAFSAAPAGVQLAGAAAAIGLLGLPHGAADLLLVPGQRRLSFVMAYLLVAAAATLLWLVAPLAGLVLLLGLSAYHFAADQAAAGDPWARWATGLLLVAAPALFHQDLLARLFAGLIGSEGMAILLTRGLATVAIGAAAMWLAQVAAGHHRPTTTDAIGLAALLLLPPLLGFAVGFVVLHAWPELRERQAKLGCADLPAFLRLTAPVLAGAALVIGLLASLFATEPAGADRLLFAAIAALAIPHMLVTPWWRDRVVAVPHPA